MNYDFASSRKLNEMSFREKELIVIVALRSEGSMRCHQVGELMPFLESGGAGIPGIAFH